MRMWRLAAVGLAVVIAATAAAQTVLPPAIQGELTTGDRSDGSGRRYDEYVIDARAGQGLSIVAAPAGGSELDPMLEVYAPGAGGQPLHDDNGGGGRSARLAVPRLANGVYRVRVLGAPQTVGAYRLTIAATGTSVDLGAVGGSVISPDRGEAQVSLPRDSFMICPGHPRCPR